jgi:hypothetical protein
LPFLICREANRATVARKLARNAYASEYERVVASELLRIHDCPSASAQDVLLAGKADAIGQEAPVEPRNS